MVSKTQIKFIKSLQYKKHRTAHNLFVAEGPKVVSELIHSSHKIHSVYGTSKGLLKCATNLLNAPIYEISPATLEKLSFLKNPNEILAVAEIPGEPPEAQLYNARLLLALDSIQDPGNLGTIIRTADWFGIKGVLCSSDTVDPFNPKVVQSAMGSLFRIPVKTGSLEKMLRDNTQQHHVYACTLDGQDLHHCDIRFPAVVVIGNESQGIQASIVANAHQSISIPRYGQAESLNASVSGAIFLHHFKKEEKA